MKVVLQRVKHAAVTVGEKTVGKIGRGYLVLLGITDTDTKEKADKLADKISKLRIFEDENNKINLSVRDIDGELMVVSQFTLYADCQKGNRPSFTSAAQPSFAEELYEYFITACKGKFKNIQTGSFGEHMDISLVNDGPFTLVLES